MLSRRSVASRGRVAVASGAVDARLVSVAVGLELLDAAGGDRLVGGAAGEQQGDKQESHPGMMVIRSAECNGVIECRPGSFGKRAISGDWCFASIEFPVVTHRKTERASRRTGGRLDPCRQFIREAHRNHLRFAFPVRIVGRQRSPSIGTVVLSPLTPSNRCLRSRSAPPSGIRLLSLSARWGTRPRWTFNASHFGSPARCTSDQQCNRRSQHPWMMFTRDPERKPCR